MASSKVNGPVLLDGRALAARAAPVHRARAAEVTRRRGRPPTLLLLAFGDGAGTPRYAARKARACADAGVEAVLAVLPRDTGSATARRALLEGIESGRPDAVFLEFPFPDGVDADSLAAAVPEPLDVDVMTGGRIRRYLDDALGPPPATVEAGLLLLDEHGVDIRGRNGVVVAEPSAFAEMFSVALGRRGARLRPLLAPDAARRETGELAPEVREAGLVVVAAGRPGLFRADELAPGAAVLDAGYFNPGGRGDVDTSRGTGHLGALAPVPGGIGPATVSALVGRVIEWAAAADR